MNKDNLSSKSSIESMLQQIRADQEKPLTKDQWLEIAGFICVCIFVIGLLILVYNWLIHFLKLEEFSSVRQVLMLLLICLPPFFTYVVYKIGKGLYRLEDKLNKIIKCLEGLANVKSNEKI